MRRIKYVVVLIMWLVSGAYIISLNPTLRDSYYTFMYIGGIIVLALHYYRKDILNGD